jgi:hypothetical protein
MIGAVLFGLLAITYLLERGCRETSAPRQWNWFELIAAEQLRVSKKARTRGDVDRAGRTHRQRAHS